jgi:hypothetical protein
MNWAAMRPAIVDAVQQATGLSMPGAVVWDGTMQASEWRPPVIVNLGQPTVLDVGSDEERRSFTATPTPARTITRSGMRQINLVVKIETQDQSDAAVALIYADRLRVRLGRQSVIETLRAAGLTVANVGNSIPVRTIRQGRVLSVYATEMLFNAVENDTDDTVGASNWIEDMTGQSQFKDPDGTTSPTQADVVVDT